MDFVSKTFKIKSLSKLHVSKTNVFPASVLDLSITSCVAGLQNSKPISVLVCRLLVKKVEIKKSSSFKT